MSYLTSTLDTQFKKSNPEAVASVEPSLYFIYYRCLAVDSPNNKRLQSLLELAIQSYRVKLESS